MADVLAERDDLRDQADRELVSRLVWLRLAQSLPWVVVDPVGAWLEGTVQEEAERLRRSSGHAGLHAVERALEPGSVPHQPRSRGAVRRDGTSTRG